MLGFYGMNRQTEELEPIFFLQKAFKNILLKIVELDSALTNRTKMENQSII
jgi:hypothetical protein